MVEDLRPGESVKTHALVLKASPFQERDLIVDVLTLDFGRLSLFAPGGARSIKRFGGTKDPLTHVLARIRYRAAEGLWRAEGFELQSLFPQLRLSYGLLESALLGAALLRELLPENQKDHALFQFFGRWLRDVPVELDAQGCRWYRSLFLLWLAHHWGHGLVLPNIDAQLRVLVEALFRDSNSFGTVIRGLMGQEMSTSDEVNLYRQWTQQCGLNSVAWEKWIDTQLANSSLRL